MRSIDQLVNSMVSKIVMILNLSSDDEVCVAVHKFGSVSQLEVGAICIKVYNILSKFSYHSTHLIYHWYLKMFKTKPYIS